MERVLHCNQCYKTFNDGANQADGVKDDLIQQDEGEPIKLICSECRAKDIQQEVKEEAAEKASCGLTTVRSSKTSKSQTNVSGGIRNAAVKNLQKPRP